MLQGALLLVLLHLLCPNTHAQSAPADPNGVTATALGPRIMRVQWQYSSLDFGISTGRQFTITVTPSRSTPMTITVDENARDYVVEGLSPYDYTSSSGVVYFVSVSAHTSSTSSSAVSASPVTLPPCPGVCNYRFRTYAGECSSGTSSLCVCNSAYTGRNCDTPVYLPGDVQASFAPQADQDTPRVTVKWDQPQSSTLDGRVITAFTVRVMSLLPSGATQLLFSGDFSPNPDSRDRNIRVIGDTAFIVPSMFLNFAVNVATVTDVTGDVAISPTVNVATHSPSAVLNLGVTSTSTTRLSYAWDPPMDADNLLTGYEFTSGSTTAMLDATQTTFTLTGLMPNTSYTVTVGARNLIGQGPLATITASTQPNVCPANQYGLPTSTVCTSCFVNSVSEAGSQTSNDCQCNPGYEPDTSGNSCQREYRVYKIESCLD